MAVYYSNRKRSILFCTGEDNSGSKVLFILGLFFSDKQSRNWGEKINFGLITEAAN